MNKKHQARRALLKQLTIGGGMLATVKSIPEKWVKPALDSVLLPAHAVPSCPPLELGEFTITCGDALNSTDLITIVEDPELCPELVATDTGGQLPAIGVIFATDGSGPDGAFMEVIVNQAVSAIAEVGGEDCDGPPPSPGFGFPIDVTVTGTMGTMYQATLDVSIDTNAQTITRLAAEFVPVPI